MYGEGRSRGTVVAATNTGGVHVSASGDGVHVGRHRATADERLGEWGG